MIKENLIAERIAISSYSEIIAWLGDGDRRRDGCSKRSSRSKRSTRTTWSTCSTTRSKASTPREAFLRSLAGRAELDRTVATTKGDVDATTGEYW